MWLKFVFADPRYGYVISSMRYYSDLILPSTWPPLLSS